jgi:hypothetical protein
MATEQSNDLLYVGNTGNNSITVYHHDQSGNSAPLYVIAGSKTRLSGPGALSEDAAGNLYVANGSSLLVFAHGAKGNVAPIRTLTGSQTAIYEIESMTVDQATGKIFITSFVNQGGIPETVLLRFPPGASGNTAPYAQTSVGSFTTALASDSTGQNLIAFNSTGPDDKDQQIITIPKQFANNGDESALYTIAGAYDSAIADDPTKKEYLANITGTIYRFAEDTDGNFAIMDTPAKFTPPIVSTITSDACAGQLALGYLRNIYVSNSKANGCASDAVYVYTHDASGNATPLRVLSGSATKLDRPYGIYEGT